jgi:hypothetical protein
MTLRRIVLLAAGLAGGGLAALAAPVTEKAAISDKVNL